MRLRAVCVFVLGVAYGTAGVRADVPAATVTRPATTDDLRQRAAAGNADAMYALGLQLQAGIAVEPDYVGARDLLFQAAAKGHSMAMARLGEMYSSGDGGVIFQPAESVRWLAKSAEAGCPLGMLHLGESYAAGAGVPEDEETGRQWIRRAMDLAAADAERGDPLSMYIMGGVFDFKAGEESVRQSVRWLEKSAEAGEVRAMIGLAAARELGIGGEKDLQAAMKWARRAADAGSGVGCMGVWHLYAEGLGVARDEGVATKWAEQAARRGHVMCMFEMARRHEKGIGVKQDPVRVLQWYLKAADAGDVRAMFIAGMMYHEGRGTPADAQEAVRWMRVAAERGYARRWGCSVAGT